MGNNICKRKVKIEDNNKVIFKGNVRIELYTNNMFYLYYKMEPKEHGETFPVTSLNGIQRAIKIVESLPKELQGWQDVIDCLLNLEKTLTRKIGPD